MSKNIFCFVFVLWVKQGLFYHLNICYSTVTCKVFIESTSSYFIQDPTLQVLTGF